MRSTTLPMDAFGKQAIMQYAEMRRISPDDAVRRAALHYLADSDLGRPAWRVPRFARDEAEGSPADDLQVNIDDETWTAVEREAERQGVSPGMLLRHAVLYFLAGAA